MHDVTRSILNIAREQDSGGGFRPAVAVKIRCWRLKEIKGKTHMQSNEFADIKTRGNMCQGNILA